MKLWEVMRGNVLLCEVMRGYARLCEVMRGTLPSTSCLMTRVDSPLRECFFSPTTDSPSEQVRCKRWSKMVKVAST